MGDKQIEEKYSKMCWSVLMGCHGFELHHLNQIGSHFILYINLYYSFVWIAIVVHLTFDVCWLFMLITHHHMHEVTLFVIVRLMFGYWIFLCVCVYCLYWCPIPTVSPLVVRCRCCFSYTVTIALCYHYSIQFNSINRCTYITLMLLSNWCFVYFVQSQNEGREREREKNDSFGRIEPMNA